MTPDDPDTPDDTDDNPLPIVGIGASAGGLKAFESFFNAVRTDTGLAYVVVQHLSPDQQSELTSIIGSYTSMPVELADEPARLRPDHVYIVPPATTLTVDDDVLRPASMAPDEHGYGSIDHFFQSLAENRREHAIGVVLSGTRDDGARGIVAIKARGGLTLAQAPEQAEYDSMPRAAIETGRVDLEAPAAELADRLADYAVGDRESVEEIVDESDDAERAYQGIVSRLQAKTGHDFTHYKRSTILRRIQRRIRLLKLPDLRAYRRHLNDHPDEIDALFDELLNTVTEFFRNPEAFEALEDRVVPQLYDQNSPTETIRVWIPGCSSGEEVYSIAMLLVEEARRRDVIPDFKLFASDLSEHAIEQARRGWYPEPTCATLDDERLDHFFEEDKGGYRVVNDLRDRVLFAVHDILQDPPFANQDLISCRNLLIYMDSTAQQQALEILHYALREEGFLFLGASEFVGRAENLFEAIDQKHRIYRALSTDRHILPLAKMGDRPRTDDRDEPRLDVPEPPARPPTKLDDEHHRLLAEQYAPPSLIVDSDYRILHISGDARNFLRMPRGEPSADLLESAPPEFRLDLRSALVEVFDRRDVSTTPIVQFDHHGQTLSVQLRVRPVDEPEMTDQPLAQVVFERLDEDERPTRPRAESSQSDLADKSGQSTTDSEKSLQRVVDQLESENKQLKKKLRTTVERYETTTEELQTSNEELLTINEELQSTTEELETSKEELQSTNEELTTVNEELSHKIEKLDEVNADLENLLSSTQIGTIFLDRSLAIKRYTEPVNDYFNILEADIGRPFEHVTHRLNYDELGEDIHRVVDDRRPIEREIRAQTGNWYVTRVHPYWTTDDELGGVVLTFFDITDRKEARERVAENELLFRTVFDSASDSLFLFPLEDGEVATFSEVNQAACERLGYSPDALENKTLPEIVVGSSLDFDAYLQKIKSEGEAVAEVQFETRSGARVDDEMSSRLFTLGGQPTIITVSRNIERRKAYEEGLIEAKEESERLAELRTAFLANMSHEIRTPLTSIIGVSQLLGKRDLPERQQQMVQLIQTSGQRLQQTLDSVLDISRLEAGEMHPEYRPHDLVARVREDVEMLRPVADRRDIELHFEAPDDEFEFWTDVGFVNRIVYNLVENAIKFTEEGRVDVRLEPTEEAVELTVSDTGIGIDDEFLPQLFDKFKQASSGTSRDYEGSGLGMSLVHQLTELMEGSIDVETEKGVGTTFTVVIPEHPEEGRQQREQQEDDA